MQLLTKTPASRTRLLAPIGGMALIPGWIASQHTPFHHAQPWFQGFGCRLYVRQVGAEQTAWDYRDANWSMVIAGVDPDPVNRDKIISWSRDYWEALHPHCPGGAYVNFMMEEGQERIEATYRDNYRRLAEIKTKYDPDNRFRVNQNIRPAEISDR